MKLLFITLFPEFVRENFAHSILKRAVQAGAITVDYLNPRDFTTDKHKTVDDTPFGGGAGMVLKVEPLIAAIQKAKQLLPEGKVVMLAPAGKVFCQKVAQKFAQYPELIFVTGHYEGFDERSKAFVDFTVSIGDYVLTGGELPAMVVSDAVCRLLPGVLGKIESTEHESFTENLLEYPQYTRPATSEYGDVPQVLLGGNHAEIERWRRKQMLKKTWQLRPDLLKQATLQKGDGELLLELIEEQVDKIDE